MKKLHHLKKLFKSLIIVTISIVAIIAFYSYWQFSQLHPETDDAYINANIVHIAAQVSGPVTNVYVQNNQYIKKGQLLLQIDPSLFQVAVNKARAQLELTIQNVEADTTAIKVAKAKVQQASTDYQVASKNMQRIITLVQKGLLAQSEGTQAQGNIADAKANLSAMENQLNQTIEQLGETGNNNAQIQSAHAALMQAELNLQHTQIYASEDGYLVNFDLRPGTMISAGAPLFNIIENNSWWIDANFKETDLKHIKPGQKVGIHVDIYPSQTFTGYVESISAGSGAAFSLLPPENATGNWVKVTQRFPIKIIFINPDPNFPLRVGASCSVTIDTQNYFSHPWHK